MKPTPHASYSRRGSNSPLASRTSRRSIRLRRAHDRFALQCHGLSPFSSLASTTGVVQLARTSTLPHTHPEARRKMPSVARSRTPPLHGPIPPLARFSYPSNLPDRTRVAWQHQAGRYLAADHPKLRGLAQHDLRQSVFRRTAATRLPSLVKDSIADLIASAKMYCVEMAAFASHSLCAPMGKSGRMRLTGNDRRSARAAVCRSRCPLATRPWPRSPTAISPPSRPSTRTRDDATSFYGWGGYEKGWDAVSRRWDWAGQQFKGGTVELRERDHRRHGRARLHDRHRDLQGPHGPAWTSPRNGRTA